jgi:hypothetical protein
MPVSSQIIQQSNIVGVDVYHPAHLLDEQHAQQIDNMLSVGGQLVTRPGKQGLLKTPFDDPIYAPLVYVRDDGSEAIVFTSGGKLYFVLDEAPDPDEPDEPTHFAHPYEILMDGLTSFNLQSAATQIIRSGKYAYVVDGEIKLKDLAVDHDNSNQVTSASHTFLPGDVGKRLVITEGTGYEYTDLSIGTPDENSNQVTSVVRPFQTGDVGRTLQIISGVGFTAGTYRIRSVSDGIATLDRSAGTHELDEVGKALLPVAGGMGFNKGTFEIVGTSFGAAILDGEAGTVDATGGKATLRGPLYRVALAENDTYAAEVTLALDQAPTPITAKLTNTVIEAMSDPDVWSGFPVLHNPFPTLNPPQQLITNSTFTGASWHAGSPPPNGWQTGGGAMDFRTWDSSNDNDGKDDGNPHQAAYFDEVSTWVDWEAPAPDYGVLTATITDLNIVGGTTTVKSTSIHHFTKDDVGRVLRVTGGSGFIVGSYKIQNVDDSTNEASVDHPIGTVSSMGGVATLWDFSQSTVNHAQVYQCSYQGKTVNGRGSNDIDMVLLAETPASPLFPHITDINPPIYYTDLAIDASDAHKISSTARPFSFTYDKGKVITITGGTGFNPGGYTIVDVETASPYRATLKGVAGTVSATGGTGILGLEQSSDHWGQENFGLDTPKSELDRVTMTDTLSSGVYTTFSHPMSLTSVDDDFEYVRLRFIQTAVGGSTYVANPGMQVVDVRLIPKASSGRLLIAANNVPGGHCLGGNWLRRDYTARDSGMDVAQLTDLAIDASDPAKVTNAGTRTFLPGDVGRFLIVTGQKEDGTHLTHFTTGRYKITAVDATTHVASLDAPVGDVGAVDGIGTLLEVGTPDYSLNAIVAIAYTAPVSSGTINWRLGFQKAGTKAADIAWTGPATILHDAMGTFLSVDVSTVPTATREATQFLYLQIVDDLDPSVDLSNLCTIGPLSAAGNLSVGFADYSYVVEEVYDTAYSPGSIEYSDLVLVSTTLDNSTVTSAALPFQMSQVGAILQITGGSGFTTGTYSIIAVSGSHVATLNKRAGTATSSGGIGRIGGLSTGNTTDGQVESEGSVPTKGLTPNGESAQVSLELAAPVNADTNYWYLYRYGGTFVDTYPTARLIAKLPRNDNALDPLYSEYVTWNHATRTVVDDTPDSVLQLASTLATDRNAMLWGAQAVAEWQNRIWVASGSTIAGSWQINTGQATGLYFNSINPPDDPNLPIKGLQASVGGYDNDPITALMPLGPALIILKRRSVWMLTGTDGRDFNLSGHLQAAGLGCAAIRGTALVANRLWMLHSDGLWEYDGADVAEPRSVEIEPQIAPQAYGGTRIPLDGAALLYAGKRVFLFMRDETPPGDDGITANNIAHVFDMRTGGWTRLLNMCMTSATTTSGAADTAEIFLAGYDGQLYELKGEEDIAKPGDPSTDITVTFRSRGLGQEEAGYSWWLTQMPHTLRAAFTIKKRSTDVDDTDVMTPVTVGMSALGCDASFSLTYNAKLRSNNLKIRVPNDVRGEWVDVSISASSKRSFQIVGVAAEFVQGGNSIS